MHFLFKGVKNLFLKDLTVVWIVKTGVGVQVFLQTRQNGLRESMRETSSGLFLLVPPPRGVEVCAVVRYRLVTEVLFASDVLDGLAGSDLKKYNC